jgi:hypothetical protein
MAGTQVPAIFYGKNLFARHCCLFILRTGVMIQGKVVGVLGKIVLS